jgi:K+-sensing histidine kinase KdpD
MTGIRDLLRPLREHGGVRETLADARRARAEAERAIDRAEGLQATAAALGRVLRVDEVVEIALREGLAALGAGRGVVGLLQPDGHTVHTIREVGFRPRLLEDWPTFDIDDDVPLAEAIRLREPLIIATADELQARYPRIGAGAASGGPAVVVPLIYEDRAVGGMYFRYDDANAVGESDKRFLAALGRQCASALARARLYETEALAWAQADQAQRRIRFLAEVGEVLGETDDLEAALGRIAARAVPEIADWSAVFLVEPEGSVRVAAVEHPDRERLREIEAFLAHRPPSVDDSRGAGAAIATGTVQVVVDLPAALADIELPDAARKVVESAGIRSVMYCPLPGDNVTFGTIVLATSGDRRYDEADAAFGEELGRRVGAALDKAQLNAQLRGHLADLERLLEAEHRAGELGQAFIGVVSHELRTPITTIYGGTKLLRRLGPEDEEKRAELVADIEAEADRLYRLTEDLLVLTRVERGSLEIGTEPILLRRVLDHVVASERDRWPGVRIELDAPNDVPLVGGDLTYVEQLARNLVGNAAKYAGSQATIVVTVDVVPNEVEVRVLDTGPGLAEEELDKVFDLFYRSPTTAKKASGAGIGLFVCAQLARAMGGRIWARNRAEGGSEFGFALRQYASEAIPDAIGLVLNPSADNEPAPGFEPLPTPVPMESGTI